jgi:hypothetical protein
MAETYKLLEVSKDEYMKFHECNNINPLSSFSDPDGILPFGYGCPAMDTDWGIRGTDEVLARCEMRKESRCYGEDWSYKYYIKK